MVISSPVNTGLLWHKAYTWWWSNNFVKLDMLEHEKLDQELDQVS